MGYTTLDTYDVPTCAAKCSAINGCMSFNIYFERDPSLDPGANCPNPPRYGFSLARNSASNMLTCFAV